MNPVAFNNPPIELEDAQSLLNPYLDILASCFKDAWDRWKRLEADSTGLGKPLTGRTRASFVNDHIWELIKERLSGKPEIREYERRGLRTVVIAEKVALRFKKLGNNLLASNISTVQQDMLAYQQRLEGMEEYGPLVYLTAGYVLNRINSDISDIHVTYGIGKSVAWSFQVPWLQSADMGTVLMIEPAAAVDTAPARTRRVRAKQSEQNNESQTGTE